MASLQEIQAAFASFNQGLQQLQQGRLIRKANQAVEQIRQAEMDEGQKQAALQDLARGVTTGFVGLGGDVGPGMALGQVIAGQQEQDTPSSIFEAFARGGQARETALQYMRTQEEIRAQRAAEADERIRQRSEEAFNRKEEAAEEKRTRENTIALDRDLNIAAPDANTARKLRPVIATNKKGVEQIDRLIEIYNQIQKKGNVKKLSPQLRKEAKTLQSILLGANRVAITGPGPMSEPDRALLESIIANPTDVTDVLGTSGQALQSLRENMLMEMYYTTAQQTGDFDTPANWLNQTYGWNPPERAGQQQVPQSAGPAPKETQISNPMDPNNYRE